MAMHNLEVMRNAEGSILVVISPIDENGNSDYGFRIAGPEAWGGSRKLAEVKISSNDLARYIEEFAPDVLAQLNVTEG